MLRRAAFAAVGLMVVGSLLFDGKVWAGEIFGSGIDAEVVVLPDFSACATLSDEAQDLSLVGHFTALGLVSDENRTTVVHQARPITPRIYPGTESESEFESVCVPGAFANPIAGQVTYTLEVHAAEADYFSVTICRHVPNLNIPFICT